MVFQREDFRKKTEALLELADVRLDGNRPWDLQVHDARLFARLWAEGSLGFGEAYMEGWWDCPALDAFFARVLGAGIPAKVRTWHHGIAHLHARLVNHQSRSRAFEIGQRHYDIGNALYRRMLDRRMIYSCAYWDEASDLDAAQEAKLELIGRKLQLAPGMRVLDVGCGWGGAARYFAEHDGVSVVGLTVSAEQARLARETCRGFPIEIRLEDYRAHTGVYDRIYSIGMYEHVGYRNYRTFAGQMRRCLAPDGLFLLHTIGTLRSAAVTDPWITRYIFPNSLIPSATQISESLEGLFVMEDWHNFGAQYDPTLMAWWRNFERAWDDLKTAYDERFHRMWRYYLLSCAGSFRARRNQLWQIVLSPHGVPGGYRRPERSGLRHPRADLIRPGPEKAGHRRGR